MRGFCVALAAVAAGAAAIQTGRAFASDEKPFYTGGERITYWRVDATKCRCRAEVFDAAPPAYSYDRTSELQSRYPDHPMSPRHTPETEE